MKEYKLKTNLGKIYIWADSKSDAEYKIKTKMPNIIIDKIKRIKTGKIDSMVENGDVYMTYV